MKLDILLALLLILLLLLVPDAEAQQVNTLLEVRLDPPISGVVIAWQTRSFATDANGIWKHTVTVETGVNYELVCTDGSVQFVGVRGASGMTVTFVSDSRVRFRYTSTPGSASGPITIYVQGVAATATPEPSATPQPGVIPTPAPTTTPYLWGDAMRADVRCAVEAALLEAVQVQACQRPPLDPVELAQSPLYVAALAYTPGTPGSNWVVSPGIPLTGEVVIETPVGQARAMAFADVFAIRIGARLWVAQWGACAWAGIRPGMMGEAIE